MKKPGQTTKDLFKQVKDLVDRNKVQMPTTDEAAREIRRFQTFAGRLPDPALALNVLTHYYDYRIRNYRKWDEFFRRIETLHGTILTNDQRLTIHRHVATAYSSTPLFLDLDDLWYHVRSNTPAEFWMDITNKINQTIKHPENPYSH